VPLCVGAPHRRSRTKMFNAKCSMENAKPEQRSLNIFHFALNILFVAYRDEWTH
jgi:hypothetical protein